VKEINCQNTIYAHSFSPSPFPVPFPKFTVLRIHKHLKLPTEEKDLEKTKTTKNEDIVSGHTLDLIWTNWGSFTLGV